MRFHKWNTCTMEFNINFYKLKFIDFRYITTIHCNYKHWKYKNIFPIIRNL